jgi:Asp-tRNA(Asn)/Glu-tRNA(Gln) amidotransferase A subunit family amidase
MTRTVTDAAKLLDVMVGYDSEDPVTAFGVGHTPQTYTAFLQRNGLQGVRLGVLRDTNAPNVDSSAADYKNVAAVFERSLNELRAAGATLVDPVVIPNLKSLMANDRSGGVVDTPHNAAVYFARNPNSPFKTLKDLVSAPGYNGSADPTNAGNPGSDFSTREELLMNVLKVMADNKLDAIVHKSFEHDPPLIRQPSRGIPRLNTYLMFVPAIAVPAGFTSDGLPTGITFMGRPYSEATMIKLAYAYEQATNHRKPPTTAPPLTNR